MVQKFWKIVWQFLINLNIFFFFLFSHSVMSNSWQHHGLQLARLPCPSATPGACSNSCPLSRWRHPTISSSVIPFSSCLQSFPASCLFHDTALRIRWPKYWSFSYGNNPSNKYSGLISFWIDWFYPCSPRDSQESCPAPQLESINSLSLSLLCSLNLTSVSDYRKHCSFESMGLCLQSDVSAV